MKTEKKKKKKKKKELWLILLSSSIGYILPSPGLKFRKQTNPISADETDSPKLKP